MNIQEITQELIQLNIIPSEPQKYESLKGGTVSELYLLHINGFKYVVKLNDPRVIESEANFLSQYKESKLLPKLLFTEPSYRYMVYSFLDGSTQYAGKNKKEMLNVLVNELINNYKFTPNNVGWGWADQPSMSWQSFLMERINETNKILDTRLKREDHSLVANLIKNFNLNRKPFLLHGDCGVHNFIFIDGQLRGVIDPTPVIGEPLYDLIYAFCSSPDDLTRETIDTAVGHLMFKSPQIYEEVVIGLYLRLGTCIKHHLQDFEEYLKAWHYWKDLILES